VIVSNRVRRFVVASALLSGCAGFYPFGADVTVTDYEPDETIFRNPERGFYVYSDLADLDPDLSGMRDEGHTLVWGRMLMRAYRDSARLPQSFLDDIENGFHIARDQGVKVIVRGSYGSRGAGGDYTTYIDPPRQHIQNHIDQLAPIMTRNADVIALFEAGFIGPWGEWHTTTIARDYDQGRDMISYILDHTPESRMVVLRYPFFKQQIFNTAAGGYLQVGADNAYSAKPVARTGHHNDCFLSSPVDVGTYERGEMTRAEETAYLSHETLYTVFGGETCQPHELNDCERSLEELATLHASYLNSGYHPKVLAKWAEQGCFDEVQKRLGARFVLTQSRISAKVRPGSRLRVEIDLENRGFAPLYNARNVEIILENQASGETYRFADPVDPRTWKPGSHQLSSQYRVPQEAVVGSYVAYLNLPDPSPRLQDDPRYAYRLANQGVWDASRGYNRLAQVEIQQ
jgi:hypothetical protein